MAAQRRRRLCLGGRPDHQRRSQCSARDAASKIRPQDIGIYHLTPPLNLVVTGYMTAETILFSDNDVKNHFGPTCQSRRRVENVLRFPECCDRA
jgi:hypothetical protein